MWHNCRRVSAARSWAHAREQFASVIAECDALQCELADLHREFDELRRELDETRALYDELRAVTLARQRADAEVAELHRLREIGRARAAERDPAQPLQ
jgi:chromosome segregation ATPase